MLRDVTANDATDHDLGEPNKKESATEEGNETEDEASDELLKDVATDDASGHDLVDLASEDGLEGGDETEGHIPEEMLKDKGHGHLM